MSVYEYSLLNKAGQEVSLKDYEGKVLSIANTASKCGFTPQYEGLEALYKKYKDQGLEIIAVPANEFGEQEPGTNEEIQSFCKMNYGVSFPVMAKAHVRDENTIPLFNYLTEQQGFKGFKPSDMTELLEGHLKANFPQYLEGDSIKWNFTKFLVNKKGEVVARFEPVETPESMEEQIKALLAE